MTHCLAVPKPDLSCLLSPCFLCRLIASSHVTKETHTYPRPSLFIVLKQFKAFDSLTQLHVVLI